MSAQKVSEMQGGYGCPCTSGGADYFTELLEMHPPATDQCTVLEAEAAVAAAVRRRFAADHACKAPEPAQLRAASNTATGEEGADVTAAAAVAVPHPMSVALNPEAELEVVDTTLPNQRLCNDLNRTTTTAAAAAAGVITPRTGSNRQVGPNGNNGSNGGASSQAGDATKLLLPAFDHSLGEMLFSSEGLAAGVAAALAVANWSAPSSGVDGSSSTNCSLVRMWTGDCSAAHAAVISALPPQQRLQPAPAVAVKPAELSPAAPPPQDGDGPRSWDDYGAPRGAGGACTAGGGGGDAAGAPSAAAAPRPERRPEVRGAVQSQSKASQAAVGRYAKLLMSSANFKCTEMYDMHDSLLLSKLSSRRSGVGGGGRLSCGGGGDAASWAAEGDFCRGDDSSLLDTHPQPSPSVRPAPALPAAAAAADSVLDSTDCWMGADGNSIDLGGGREAAEGDDGDGGVSCSALQVLDIDAAPSAPQLDEQCAAAAAASLAAEGAPGTADLAALRAPASATPSPLRAAPLSPRRWVAATPPPLLPPPPQSPRLRPLQQHRLAVRSANGVSWGDALEAMLASVVEPRAAAGGPAGGGGAGCPPPSSFVVETSRFAAGSNSCMAPAGAPAGALVQLRETSGASAATVRMTGSATTAPTARAGGGPTVSGMCATSSRFSVEERRTYSVAGDGGPGEDAAAPPAASTRPPLRSWASARIRAPTSDGFARPAAEPSAAAAAAAATGSATRPASCGDGAAAKNAVCPFSEPFEHLPARAWLPKPGSLPSTAAAVAAAPQPPPPPPPSPSTQPKFESGCAGGRQVAAASRGRLSRLGGPFSAGKRRSYEAVHPWVPPPMRTTVSGCGSVDEMPYMQAALQHAPGADGGGVGAGDGGDGGREKRGGAEGSSSRKLSVFRMLRALLGSRRGPRGKSGESKSDRKAAAAAAAAAAAGSDGGFGDGGGTEARRQLPAQSPPQSAPPRLQQRRRWSVGGCAVAGEGSFERRDRLAHLAPLAAAVLSP